MKFERPETVDEFRDVAYDFLAQREPENNLLLGILVGNYDWPSAWFGVVRDDAGIVVRAAICTPPFGVAMSAGEAGAAEIASGLSSERFAFPWILTDEADRAEVASALGLLLVTAQEETQHIYELTRVAQVRPASGRARDATEQDIDKLAQWWEAFQDDVGIPPELRTTAARQTVESAIGRDEMPFVVWSNEGDVVSMARAIGPTPTGIRLGAVYTPNDQRGKGYATNLVAALSQRLFEQGRERVFLFTQDSNPTSNSIYQQIGYRRVRTVVRLIPQDHAKEEN